MRLNEAVAEVLDRRLARDEPAPLLVALSGGGDSLALLLAARAWASGAGRRLVAATVDHRLQAQGLAWAKACEARCAALGVPHLTLTWTDAAPPAGLAAAARSARHRLLAQAARSIGARVILLGHTADDLLEAAWMRACGARTPSPREWTPSPAWPQGRGVFLLRPLLGARRADLREALTLAHEAWIEDPANEDPHSLRARARLAIAGGEAEGSGGSGACRPGAPPLIEGPCGELTGRRADFANAPRAQALAWLGAAVACAAGGDRFARRESLQALLERAISDAPLDATLAGARVTGVGERLTICREATDRRGEPAPDLDLPAGATVVWDGRYELTAREPGLCASAARGRLGALAGPLRRKLSLSPRQARGGALLVRDTEGRGFCPTVDGDAAADVRSLIMARLLAACGEVDHERAIV